MKKGLLLLLALLLVVALVGCGGGTPAAGDDAAADDAAADDAAADDAEEGPAPDPWGDMVFAPGTEITIGVSSALAGDYAVYGQDMLNGVDLAIEDAGGLNGWTVVSEGGDDQCDGAPGVTVAEQFAANSSLLAVVGPMCSGSVVPASEIYAKNNIIMITPSSTAVIVTAQGYENLFRLVANDDLQAEVTVGFLSEDKGIKSLAVMHDKSIYGEGVAQAVKDKFEAGGGTVTTFEGIERGVTDFSAVISSILTGNPEAVYFGGMDAEGVLIVSQLRAAGFEGVFMGPDGLKNAETYIGGSGGAAEGSFVTFGAVGGATGYDEWEPRFIEKYGGAPVAYGPGSYDAARIILQAAAKVAYVDADGNLVIGRKAMADAIRATPYDGLTGHLEFTATGDLAAVSITVFEVKGEDFVEVKTVDFGK